MAIDLDAIVEKHIHEFNRKRLKKIRGLRLSTLLKDKNPYLFVARNVFSPNELARSLVMATLSSSEETLFGKTLEDIAIEVCSLAYGGQKSTSSGIDLDFNRNGRRYLVSIKSGPRWSNSRSENKLVDDFRKAFQTVGQGADVPDVVAINGCCSGREISQKTNYRKICGGAFWELVSGDPELYTKLIDPLTRAGANGFRQEVEDAITVLTDQLVADWSDDDGGIDWHRIVEHNASN